MSAVGVGVGVGVGVATTTSGDGTGGELAMSALAAALFAGLSGLAIAELLARAEPAALVVAGEPIADVDPADEGWLLVQAARAAAQRTATTQRAGVGLVVRSRLAIVPG